MPELPEVETARLGLEPFVAGRTVAGVWIGRADLRRAVPEGLGQSVTGRRVEALARRGKVMIWHLDDGGAVLIHLGMSGRVSVCAGEPPPARHDHVRFRLDSGDVVTFHDPRRFGFVDHAPPGRLELDPLLARLGPEPLGPGFDAAVLAAGLAGRAQPIKLALLDQAVVAGLGNIYVCESLFRAGISPFAAAGSLGPRRVARLAAAIRAVLAEAVAAGGSTLRDHRRPDGGLGYFQMAFRVYDREGGACPGGKPGHAIKRVVQGGRSTYYCPHCQR